MYKAAMLETKYWCMLMHMKYMTGPQKFIFEDEQSARSVYESFSETLKKHRDYSNDHERTFTFTSLNEASTTIDISDVSYISVNPPAELMIERYEND